MNKAAATPEPFEGSGWGVRARASLIHLGICALVAAGAALVVFVGWYPNPFDRMMGAGRLFVVLVSVDVALGPLITLAIFDRRKAWRELRRDLVMVALLQLTALGYGLHTMYVARPVAIVLEGTRLRLVRAIDIDRSALAMAPAEWRSLPWWGVNSLATRPPAANEKLNVVEMALQGIDIGMRPEFWLPQSATEPAYGAVAKPWAVLHARFPNRVAELRSHAARAGLDESTLGFIPVLAQQGEWVALIDRRHGKVVGFAPFDGF